MPLNDDENEGIKEEVSVEKMRQEMGIMKIMEVIRMGRLRWFRHVRREESSWVDVWIWRLRVGTLKDARS